MAKLNLATGKRALIVMAHPDDESIWMGGFIFKHPELDWTILSLCRASDPDRAPKFNRVCAALNATAIMEDMDDEGHLSFDQTVTAAKKLIRKHLSKVTQPSFDYLFTHGKNGEYGHLAHRAIHEAINQLHETNKLGVEKIFFLNYKRLRTNNKLTVLVKKDSDHVLLLNQREFATKKKLMTELYGFTANGIDANLCTNPEAFKIINR